jgi:acetyl esterase/lipase
VDPARLVLAGSSMGGYATLAAGAADPRFFALVPVCPLLDGVDAPMPRDLAVESAAMLRGVSADELQRQWSALPSIVSLAGQLRGRRMLLVTGERDELFPPAHYAPLSLLLPEMQRQHFAVGDHGFSLCRPALVATIVQWLKELARP